MSAAPKPQIQLKPVEIKNILFATDFGTASDPALRYAHAIAARHGSKVYVLHVLPPEARISVPLDKFPTEFDRVRQEAAEHMTKLLGGESMKGVAHDALIERGNIAEIVPATVETNSIDMVIVGTHGHRGLKKLMLGSVAEEIFRSAMCPVLTVGPHIAKDGMETGEFPHVLFTTDFSPGSIKALSWALWFARQSQAQLTLLHVIDEISEAGVEYLDEVQAACKQRMAELLPAGTGEWCHPQFFVDFGPAADTITKIAEEQHTDLIVMGARKTAVPMATMHLPWATAYRVVCNAHCPVLTVRG